MNAVSPDSIAPTAGGLATELRVEGMTCNNCARHVTTALQTVAGVQSAMVNLESSRATVRWGASGRVDNDKLIQAVTAAGYEAALVRPDSGSGSEHHHGHDHDWKINLWLGGIVTTVLMLGEWVFHFGMTGWFAWTSFALAGLVQVFSGAQFYRGAWRQLKIGSYNMDTLVALGSTTAFGYSVWALLSGGGHHLW
jgi:Cu+-exporting ATPase